MKIIKEHKMTILISLGIGIIIFYLQPLLSWVGTKALDFLLLISDLFSNHYYSSIALNNPNLFSSYITYILSIAIAFGFYFVFQRILDSRKKMLNEIETSLEKIRTRIENYGKEHPEEKKTEEELLEELKNLEPRYLGLKEKAKKSKNLNLFRVSVISLAILLFGNYIFYSTISIENTKFRNKMIILAPELEESTIKELKSDWYQMETKEHYDIIQNKIKVLDKT